MTRYLGDDRRRRAAAPWVVVGDHPVKPSTTRTGSPRAGTNGTHHSSGRDSLTRSSSPGGGQVGELMEHLALAVTRHIHHLRQDALQVPPYVEELAAMLIRCVQTRPIATPADHMWTLGSPPAQDENMMGRLLVTKAEAAELLGVSVRTVERLVAHGQLPLLHIERASRIRLADIEAYVDSLAGEQVSPGQGGQEP